MTRNSPLVYLMYHELELPGRELCDSEPGYVRYIVRQDDFKKQVVWLKTNEWQGLSVTHALAENPSPAVVFTFDDGAETDLIAAASILRDAGFGATFYITTGFLGKRGYLSPAQVRELAELGFDIGCHSRTHPYLSDLPDSQMSSEIVEPKLQLEQITGRSCDHFSCPGGRYDMRVVKSAKEAGYHSLATSRALANTPTSDRFSLGRVAIMRNTSLADFQDICAARGLWKRRTSEQARNSVKRALGNAAYDRLRGVLLGRNESKQ